MNILQQYDPNATLLKKGAAWLFTFKGELIINATPDAKGDVYLDVFKLLYIFDAIANAADTVAVIASNAKPQSNADTDDNDDADNDNASKNGPSNSNFKNSPSSQTPESPNQGPDNTSGGTNIGGTNSGGTQCSQSSTTHSQDDPLYLPASGTLKEDYEEFMSSLKPDEIIMGEKDSTAHTETLQDFFEYGYVPDLFFLKDGNDNHRAFLTKSGNIGFLVIPSNIYPNARKDADIPSSVKQAQLFYNCFGNPNLKSMKSNIDANPHLPFTLKDVKMALQIYGNIPADVGNMKRKRTRRRASKSATSTSLGDRSVTPAVVAPPRPPPDPVIPPWPPPPTPTKTTIPGHTIHVDIKQTGGLNASASKRAGHAITTKVSVLHGKDEATGLLFATEIHNQITFSNALSNLIGKFNLAAIDSTIEGTGRVKVVRMDADPLVTTKIIDSFMEKGVKIKLAERNYHERSAEISIQHVERVLSRILLSLPFYAPVWLATAFWIAIYEMLNFLITYPNQQSPSDK